MSGLVSLLPRRSSRPQTGSVPLGVVCRVAKVTCAAIVVAFGSSCGHIPPIRGEIDALRSLAEQAEHNGAIRCAPRELALAKSHIEFAAAELDKGFFPRATEHLDIARANAHAAYEMSPPEKCAEREFQDEPQPGDRDGDGIPDNVDKCPDDPENYNGFEDDDGCPDDPDTDGDGIPDSRDQCPLLAEDKDGYLDDDGCPDPDNDLDTVPDALDKDPVTGQSCANDPEDPDGFEDEDGCPATTTRTGSSIWTTTVRTSRGQPPTRDARRSRWSWSRTRRSRSCNKFTSNLTRTGSGPKASRFSTP